MPYGVGSMIWIDANLLFLDAECENWICRHVTCQCLRHSLFYVTLKEWAGTLDNLCIKTIGVGNPQIANINCHCFGIGSYLHFFFGCYKPTRWNQLLFASCRCCWRTAFVDVCWSGATAPRRLGDFTTEVDCYILVMRFNDVCVIL